MPTYRAYVQKDGQIVGPPALIEASSVDEAIRKAREEIPADEEIGLWLNDRRVALLQAARPQRT